MTRSENTAGKKAPSKEAKETLNIAKSVRSSEQPRKTMV